MTEVQTTDDLWEKRGQLWTEGQLEALLSEMDVDLQPWQHDLLVQLGRRRQVGVVADLSKRGNGKMLVYRLTRDLAQAMGYRITDTKGGFLIELRE